MASEVKGITIQFRGDATQFEAAVNKVKGELKQTGSEVSLLNKKLKFDPKNVELLGQKFDALKNKQKLLSEQADILRQTMGKLDPNSKEWANLNVQLQKCEGQLASLSHELDSLPSAKVQAMSQSFEEWGSKLDKVGKGIEDVGKKLSIVSAGIVGLATSGVKFNAQLEQYQTAFTTLIGDADKATEAIARIQSDASLTPFSTESLIEANQYLISAGVEAEESEKMILALGDAIAATGGGSNELSRMAQNLQQIKNLGKASSVDIKQFANAGINIYGLLAETTGKSVKQLQEMDITYDQLLDAFSKASSEGGKYFGAMEKQSQTLNGSISSLKDQINQLLGELTAELMPIIKDVLQYIRDFLTMLKEMSPEQQAMLTRVAEFVALLGPALTIIGGIVQKVGGLSTGLSNLLKSEKVVSLFAKLTSNGTSLFSVLKTIVSTVANAVGWWGVLIGVLITLYTTNEDIRNAINELINTLIAFLKPTLDLIITVVQTMWELFKLLLETLINLWKEFANTSGGKIFIGIIKEIIQWVTRLVDWLISMIGWLQKAFNWFLDLIGVANDFNDTSFTVQKDFKQKQGRIDMVQSGGFASSGNTITLNANFSVNSNNITRQDVRSWASWLTDDINEQLGKRIR